MRVSRGGDGSGEEVSNGVSSKGGRRREWPFAGTLFLTSSATDGGGPALRQRVFARVKVGSLYGVRSSGGGGWFESSGPCLLGGGSLPLVGDRITGVFFWVVVGDEITPVILSPLLLGLVLVNHTTSE